MEVVERKVITLIFHDLLSRLIPTLFARYRYTATIVSLILAAGYESPHTTLDQYVLEYSGFRPTDGVFFELELPESFILNDMVAKLNFSKMCES
jgi:hypothetical protein